MASAGPSLTGFLLFATVAAIHRPPDRSRLFPMWIPDNDPQFTNVSVFRRISNRAMGSWNVDIAELEYVESATHPGVTVQNVDSVASQIKRVLANSSADHTVVVNMFRHGRSKENQGMGNVTGNALNRLELEMMFSPEWVDAPLVADGVARAQELAPLLSKLEAAHPFDLALTSPVSRALQTCWYATEAVREARNASGGALPIHATEGLREALVSRCSERRPLDEILNQPPTGGFSAAVDFGDIPAGPDPLYPANNSFETPQMVAARAKAWMAQFVHDVARNGWKNVLWSTHSWILFALLNVAADSYHDSRTLASAGRQWANTELRSFVFTLSAPPSS